MKLYLRQLDSGWWAVCDEHALDELSAVVVNGFGKLIFGDKELARNVALLVIQYVEEGDLRDVGEERITRLGVVEGRSPNLDFLNMNF